MATKVVFNGDAVTLPGSYAAITSAPKAENAPLSSGNILLIDTGLGAGFGGAGVNGTNLNKKNAIFTFTDSLSMKEYLRGSELYALADALFSPFGNFPGAPQVSIIHAKASTPSTLTLDLTAGAAGGTIVLHTVEGSGSVGVLNGTNLKTGFAFTMEAGTYDSAKFRFKFWRGKYTGTDAAGVEWDGIADPAPELIAATGEISTMAELDAFMQNDLNFIKWFKVNSTATVGLGTIDPADLLALAGSYQLAVGGTETYSAAALDDALVAVQDLDYTFVMTDKSGANAGGAENLKVLAHIKSGLTRFTKFMLVGGSDTSANFVTQSIDVAKAFDDWQAVVVHGGITKNASFVPGGVRKLSSLHKVAYVLGRLAGIEPQNPVTFKLLGYDGEQHEMTKPEQEFGLKHGLLMTKYDSDLKGRHVILGVNTLQDNIRLLNADATSYSLQAMRIIGQINKILEIDSKLDLLANQTNGATKANLKDSDVLAWVSAKLLSMEASDVDPSGGLIITFQDVTVARDQDYINVTYSVELNTEINKLFFEGAIFRI